TPRDRRFFDESRRHAIGNDTRRVTIRIQFDRGTLRLFGESAARMPGVVWDGRIAGWRAPAYRYANVLAVAASTGVDVDDEIAARLASVEIGRWLAPELRAYQEAALRAWRAAEMRGLAAMPTGSGKTILAVAALAHAGGPALVVCPTRALLEQWVR